MLHIISSFHLEEDEILGFSILRYACKRKKDYEQLVDREFDARVDQRLKEREEEWKDDGVPVFDNCFGEV